MTTYDQAEGLRRLLSPVSVRQVAILEPGQDSGAVAIALAGALTLAGRSSVVVRAGRLRAYRYTAGSAPSSCLLAGAPDAQALTQVQAALGLPFDVLLRSDQAESWHAAPGFVAAADEVLIVLHAGEDPAQALAWIYGCLKVLAGRDMPASVRLAVRGGANATQALAIHARIAHVASRYLGKGLSYAGHLPVAVGSDLAVYRPLAESLLLA